MRKILFIAFLLLSNYGICQFTSMIDVAEGKWDYQRSGVATSILRALEKREPEVALQFFKNAQRINIKDLTIIANLISEKDPITEGFPPVYINRDTLKNNLTYQRIYYKRQGTKREYLFQVNIFLAGNEFNLRADSIKFTKEVNLDSINYLLEMIRCGSYPPGPPAHKGFYDWETRKITKAYKTIKLTGSEKIPDELLNSESYLFSVILHTKIKPDEQFWSSANIESLEVSPGWDTLPNEIGNLVNLKWLKLDNGFYKEIPKEIGNLVNLQSLYIKSNSLQFLPETIGNLKNLKELTIYGSEFHTLPNSISNLNKLDRLALFYTNKVSSFPENMSKLTHLREIVIWGCDRIPTIITPIKSVKEIHICFVENIDEIVNFTGLKELHSIGCAMNEVPLQINNLKELEKIELRSYKFKTFPKAFEELENIKTITLYSGLLETFPTNLKNAKNVVQILIDEAKITKIPEAIREFENLRSLTLKSNNLEELPTVLFDIPNLKSVNLSHNKIQKLPDNIEEINPTNFFELNLLNNPIDISTLKGKKLPFKLKTK